MAATQAEVVQIYENDQKTKYGMKKTYNCKMSNGDYVKTGFKKPPFGQGAVISYDPDRADKWGNYKLEDISQTTAGTGVPVPAAVGQVVPKSEPTKFMTKDRMIVRQNALSHSTNLYLQGLPSEDQSLDSLVEHAESIVELARVFEDYAMGESDEKKVREMIESGESND